MSKRQHTRANRLGLREALLHEVRTGVLAAGDALPPLRELASKHGLSPATTQRVLRSMADEGILNLRQGAGAFVSQAPVHSETTFAIAFADDQMRMQDSTAVREGFEAEISKRAGASLALTPRTNGLQPLLRSIASGDIKIGGAFFVPSRDSEKQTEGLEIVRSLGSVPLTVLTSELGPTAPAPVSDVFDSIRFDDVDGAQQAVRHLWGRGHRKLAFLGIHDSVTRKTKFPRSAQRAAGFQAAMEQLKVEPRVCLPAREPARLEVEDQKVAAAEAARSLLPSFRDGSVRAVVCVNQPGLFGLLKTIRDAKLPKSLRPAIVAFDGRPKGDHLLSAVHSPWDDLGRAAATALWERVFGTLAQRDAAPREILVPMRMVARLSCSTNQDKNSIAHGTFATAEGRDGA